jgi:hypothetical protein
MTLTPLISSFNAEPPDMKTSSSRAAAFAVLLLLSGAATQAEVIDIQWTGNGRFDKALSVAPGKFAEVCGKLVKGRTVEWSFKAESALDFNIHFHAGKKVEFPAKVDGLSSAAGALAVSAEQDYCWMWTNKADKPSALTLSLQN